MSVPPRPRRSDYSSNGDYNVAVAYHEERYGKSERRTGRATVAIVTGAIGVYGVTTGIPQSGSQPLKDEADASVQSERSNRARSHRGATRDKGNRTGGSHQS